MTIKQIYEKFPKHIDCIKFLETYIWNDQPKCPFCESGRKTKSNWRYHCNNCNSNYSVMVNTMFKGSRLELQKWFIAIEFVLTGEKIIGIRDLAKELNVTINTSSRIRAKILQNAVLYLDFTDRITQFKN